MTLHQLRRVLFFASEAAVVGVIVVYYLKERRAAYFDPVLPAFWCGLLGLLIVGIWSYSSDRRISAIAFCTLALALAWLFLFCAVLVE